ncbi:response regulator transcription factor [Aliidiomarina maris]|uniref:DNA-binding response OmpR family regulator n=1 Tax=Aliidiomarina maris TaxID=531312 RepID=A0A327X3W1_9GAMM|nr:response regulator transcription factor [Aliidiomarina maris]MCL4410519.1 response regulator transcription factor [Gammaproteobacteria bacterium]RAK01421.1 DNA-binding response OmpR family regulator [Aliidiomarina maris]RUO28263.1 DNA-binding response regulator [Aliidiomarina maris]
MTILVVEDDPRVADFLQRGLRAEGYQVDVCSDGAQAVACVQQLQPEVVILDRMLPNLDGVSVCQIIRGMQLDTKIIMLSALNEVDARVEGLRIGADDYMGKPFSFEELLLRIEIQRNSRHASPGTHEIRQHDIVFNLDKMSVTKGAQKVEFTAKELAILEVLMRTPGKVFSRERILSKVWGLSEDPLTNVVDVYIGRLRKKLDAQNPERYIQTLRGLGYFWVE